ncbi:MAG: DUF2520 domain-containing protein [Flavobacteriaceae bacterium]|nr:DUF2520 domain-containing protein [Flavobacteriaceae bacterium]
MIKVVVLGSGNIGYHLSKVFLSSNNIDLIQVYSRDINSVEYLTGKVPITDSIETILDADIYILAISDRSISDFSKLLKVKNKLVVHTSGTVSINNIQCLNKGAFYPVQTFSKERELDFSHIPICIETTVGKDLILLKKLASSISKEVYVIDSLQRKKIHLAAVFVNNFTNHLYEIGREICEENSIPFEILLPIIKETAEKLNTCSPLDAQTGPAKRKDSVTTDEQVKQLAPNNAQIYSILTQSILKKHNPNEY